MRTPGIHIPRLRLNLSLVLICGGFCLGLGLLVLLGWHLHFPELVQTHPSLVPMQYNTALGFLLCGVGLIRIFKKNQIWGTLSGAALLLLSSLTLLEYVWNLDLGIDEMFMKHYITVKTPQPGRMAPNTALGFLLCGAALMLCARRNLTQDLLMAILSLNALVLSLSSVALGGYLAGLETAYGWGNMTPMALNTALGFIAFSLGMLKSTREIADSQGIETLPWVPVLVALAGLTVTVFLWQALAQKDILHIEGKIQEIPREFREHLENLMGPQALAIVRMAQRWEYQRPPNRAEWESDARLYVNHYKTFQAVEWVDSDLQVQWVVPLQGNEKARVKNLNDETRRQAAFANARNKKTLTTTRTIHLAQGGIGFLIIHPIFLNSGDFGGYIVGVLRVERLMDQLLKEEFFNGYSMVLLEGHEVIYNHQLPSALQIRSWTKEDHFEFENIRWTIRVQPTREVLAREKSSLPDAVMGLGLVLSILLGVAAHLAQKANSRTREIESAQRDLEKEIVMRKRTEEELRVLSKVIEQSPSPVMITDTYGHIQYVNASFTDFTGYTLREILGKKPNVFKSGKHPPEFYKQLWDTLLEGKTWRGDICNRKKNGDLFWELQSITPLYNREGEIRYFASLMIDDTERRRAEEKLQHYTAELERSNQALQDFAYIASHDLQEPLRKIIAFSDRVQAEVEPQNEKARDYLSRVIRATQRMQCFIDDLLAYSRIHTKGQPFALTDLDKIVGDVISDLEVRIAQTGAQIEVRDLPTLSADAMQMRQLFTNLIANALKFNEPARPLRIQITGKLLEKSRQWEIRVQDNGIGFDEIHKERIFKPFERLHGRSQYEGSGVGLAICKKIVHRHKGEITVTSCPGEGSTFILYLPGTSPPPI